MNTPISDPILHEFGDFVRATMGLHYPQERVHELERGIRSAAQEFGFDEPEKCLRWLLSSATPQRQIEALANHLAIGETYFFRHPETWEALEQHVLPQLIRERSSGSRSLKVWSAGCSTGEEPYTLAILLDRLIPDRQAWEISVLATDISKRVLRKASEALYTEWSFRGVPAGTTDRYFTRTADGRYKLGRRIREMVRFDYLNLIDDSFVSMPDLRDTDLIFCRNVFIYFSAEQAGRVVRGFHQVAGKGGWLVTSPVETVYGIESDFSSVKFGKATLFTKTPSGSRRGREARPKVVEAVHRPAVKQAGKPSPHKTAAARAARPRTIRPVASAPVQRPDKAAQERDSAYASAAALCEQGRYHDAMLFLNGLVTATGAASSTGCPEALMARCWANLGDREAALSWVQRALTANKTDAGHHYLRAVILQENGELDEAATALRRSLFLNRDFVLAHYTLGVIQGDTGRPDEARRSLRNALRSLRNYEKHEILPESDGIAAGRLEEMIAGKLQGD